MKNKIMENKIEQTKTLLEKISGQSVTLVETKKKKEDASALHAARDRKLAKDKEAEKKAVKKEALVTEAKDKEETPKEKKVEKATEKAADVAPASIETTAAGIIAPASIEAIRIFVADTIINLEQDLLDLKAIQLDANTTVSAEDYYVKAEDIQKDVKQLARIATYVKNTIIAQKFDKELLDKIISYKNK